MLTADSLGAQPRCESRDEGLAKATRHLGYDAVSLAELVDREERSHHLEFLELFAKRPLEATLELLDFVHELVKFV